MTEPLSLEGQADLLWSLLSRCILRNKETAAETWLLLDARDHEELKRLEVRLRKMAKHEAKIRELVTRG